MTDLAAIDLDVIRKRSAPTVHAPGAYDINRLIAAVEALRERVETARLEVEQCHAKSTCCCGDYMKQHSAYNGHTPVAMYDYALDGAEARAGTSEAHATEMATEVKALRERMAALGEDNARRIKRVEAAEAHATEMVGALEVLRDHFCYRNCPAGAVAVDHEDKCKSATAALTTTPVDALERARAKDEALRSILRGNPNCCTLNQLLSWAQGLARDALLDDGSSIHSDRGGFIDGNDHKVVAGDRVEYRFENHRRGVLDEALQDGDALVTWDDGSHTTVKWCHLAKVI